DAIAVLVHSSVEFTFDSQGDVVFFHENIVEAHLGHLSSDHVKNVRGDLVVRVFESVKSVEDLVFQHKKLHADFQAHEHIVACFGFDRHVELLHAEAQSAGHPVDEGHFKLQTCEPYAAKFSEPFDHGGRLLLHGKNASKEDDEDGE